MFSHDDNHDDKDDKKDDQSQQNAAAAPDVAPDQPADNAADAGQSDQAAPPSPDDSGLGDDSAPADDTAAPTGDDDSWQHPGAPIDDGPEQISDIIAPAGGHDPNPTMPSAPPQTAHHDQPAADDTGDEPVISHELIDVKQKALKQLTPLMDELDQPPEDKFRTIMMMIQSSDDQSLVKKAYEAANAIEDEKLKAQALLDIVNEINYFTQHPASDN